MSRKYQRSEKAIKGARGKRLMLEEPKGAKAE